MVLLPPCDCENSSGVVVATGGVPDGCREEVRDMDALNCRPSAAAAAEEVAEAEEDPPEDPGISTAAN